MIEFYTKHLDLRLGSCVIRDMIVKLPNVRVATLDPYPFNEAEAQAVQCDFCGRRSSRVGGDPGAAAEQARKVGFRLIAGKRLTDPMKWTCGCK